MAIAPKPKRPLVDTDTADPMAFIQGAAHHQTGPISPPEGQGARKKRKEPVIIRFDEETLRKVDTAAAKRGLSRAALVRMLVIEHLPD
jgi:Ribbon-helix-helix protein, copG family